MVTVAVHFDADPLIKPNLTSPLLEDPYAACGITGGPELKAKHTGSTSYYTFSSIMSRQSTGTSTPTSPPLQSTSAYLSYPVSHIASSLYRRFTDPNAPRSSSRASARSVQQPLTPPGSDMPNGVYTPPHRNASPFQPPPLTPLTLSGADEESTTLSKAIAEEIRLLIPPRLQLAETWNLVYSLDNDGVSLATLYHKCASPKLARGCGFIMVVQDAAGGVCGFQS